MDGRTYARTCARMSIHGVWRRNALYVTARIGDPEDADDRVRSRRGLHCESGSLGRIDRGTLGEIRYDIVDRSQSEIRIRVE